MCIRDSSRDVHGKILRIVNDIAGGEISVGGYVDTVLRQHLDVYKRQHHNLAMKNLLLDTLVEVVGYRTDQHSMRKPGNLTRWNERVHLRVDGGGKMCIRDRGRTTLYSKLEEYGLKYKFKQS